MARRCCSRLSAIAASVIAICVASCSSQDAPPAAEIRVPNIQLSPAPAGSCQIDGVKMCQVTDGFSSALVPQTPPASKASSLEPPASPDSLEFQIPAGQTINLLCYYDAQHKSLARAEATAESPLTGNSVQYMKQHGFCSNK